MSMIDPDAPCYTFSYEKILFPKYKYVKDNYGEIHRICLNEYVKRHNASEREEGVTYVKYSVHRRWYPESRLKRVMNILMDREDVVKFAWLEIKSQFYSSGMYMTYSPSGLVKMEEVYDTYEEAENGVCSNMFREYNLKED